MSKAPISLGAAKRALEVLEHAQARIARSATLAEQGMKLAAMSGAQLAVARKAGLIDSAGRLHHPRLGVLYPWGRAPSGSPFLRDGCWFEVSIDGPDEIKIDR